MLTQHRSFAILVTALILAASFTIAGIPSVNAAGISLGYGGDGVWRQTATANSQRWFRVRVTWDNTISEGEAQPNERIDGLYLTRGVSFHNTVAAPSGETYRSELTGGKGIWDAGRRAATGGLSPVVILNVVEPGRTRFYYTATRFAQPYVYPAGSLAGYELSITPVLTGVPDPPYTVTGNGSDFLGDYIDVSSALSSNVAPVLSVWQQTSATRVYYRGANLTTVQYPRTWLAGETLRFLTGVAAGNNYPIATNDDDLDGYYIQIVETDEGDYDLPAGLLPPITVVSQPSATKFYYTGGAYADDELIGQTMLFTTGAAADEERVIADNGTDTSWPWGTWIESAPALPTLLTPLTVSWVPDVRKLYYTGYAHTPGSLNGLSLAFDTINGVAQVPPVAMTIDTNGTDGGGDYITTTADLPATLVLTVSSVPAANKLYYTGVTYTAGSLAGLSLAFDTINGVAQTPHVAMTVNTNGTDGGGNFITTTAALPAGLIATDTFYVTNTFYVNDVVLIEDQCVVPDTGMLTDLVHADDLPKHFGVAWEAVSSADQVVTVGPFSCLRGARRNRDHRQLCYGAAGTE